MEVKTKRKKKSESAVPMQILMQLPSEMVEELKGSKVKNDAEVASTITQLRTGLTSLTGSIHRHRMEHQSNLIKHKVFSAGELAKHKKNVDQIETELKEAFTSVWTKFDTLESLVNKNGGSFDESTKKHTDSIADLSTKIVNLTSTVEKRYQAALKRINQQKDKVEVRIDNGEVRSVRGELTRLEGLIEKVGKYEYGAQLQVQAGGSIIGFTGIINFKTGFTVVQNNQGVDITANAAGGITTLAPNETPNGSITVFTLSTATAKPSFVVSDHSFLPATDKDGTVNWTWNNGTKKVTMTVAPNDDIFGIV